MLIGSFNSSFLHHQYQRQVKMYVSLFLSHVWLPLEFVFTYNTSLMRWEINNKYLMELIKRRSKVKEKIISCWRALNFDQLKTFFENYKPGEFHYCLFTNLPRMIIAWDFFRLNSNSNKVPYLSYPTWKLLLISS